MELDKNYEFADRETAEDFNQQRWRFKRENDRDRYQSYSETFEIPGHVPFALCCRHGERPKGLSLCLYVVATFFMCSYFYRMWLEKLSVQTNIDIRKRVSSTPMQNLTLVMAYHTAGNIAVQTAVVYQELYGVPQPNIPVAVSQALPPPTAVAVPVAYAGPVANPVSAGESTAEERQQMYAQLPGATAVAPAPVAPLAAAVPANDAAAKEKAAIAIQSNFRSMKARSMVAAEKQIVPDAAPVTVQKAVVAPAAETMNFVVPAGIAPGQVIVVNTPSGRQVQVTIPAGVAAGQTLQINA